MTERLYDENSYLKKFSAQVLSCEKKDKEYVVVLDKTAFFPEEGGQCCDKGKINGIDVNYVEIKDNIIYHIIKEPLEPGTTINGEIDWEIRYRNMQNHTAEHIVSGIVHSLYGYENVGFHLGEVEVTADYDSVLSREELDKIELMANKAVYKNVEIKAWYPDADELSKVSYRSKKEIKEGLRLVSVEGYDLCACCAPHVKNSGEIGIIRLVGSENLRGGSRVRILCSLDALADYSLKSRQTLNISNLLCAKQNEVGSAVLRLKEENEALKQKNSSISKALANIKAEAVEETEGNIVIKDNELEFDYLRIIINNCKSKCRIICIISGNDTDGYKYIIGSDKVPLREKAKEMNAALNGRGGGSNEMIQGTFAATEKEISEYFKTDKA